MLQKELAAARKKWVAEGETEAEEKRRQESDFLKYKDSDGCFVDFHATRHTYISAIVAGGASVKTCQELARHSDPRLTIGRYSHARLHDLQGALEGLPDLQPQGPEQPAQRATGTDGQTTDGSWGQMRGQYGGKTVRESANCGERHETSTAAESTPEAEQDASPNVLSLQDLATKKPRLARRGEKAEGTGFEPATPYGAPHFECGC